MHMNKLILTLAILIPAAHAQPNPEMANTGETQQVYSAQVHKNACTKLVADLKNKFGFDVKERIESQRSRESNGVILEAMALKDGTGPRKALFPAPANSGMRDIIGGHGASTFRTFKGFADDARTIPVFKIELFSKKTGNAVEVIARLKNNHECHVNHIKVYPEGESHLGKPLSTDDCKFNTITMTRTGRVAVNANQTDEQKACSAVWTFFENGEI
jgi:hypothetical protein